MDGIVRRQYDTSLSSYTANHAASERGHRTLGDCEGVSAEDQLMAVRELQGEKAMLTLVSDSAMSSIHSSTRFGLSLDFCSARGKSAHARGPASQRPTFHSAPHLFLR